MVNPSWISISTISFSIPVYFPIKVENASSNKTIYSRSLEIFSILIKNGAEIGPNNESNELVKHERIISYAAEHGNIEIIKILLEKFMTTESVDTGEAMYYVIEHAHLNIVELFLMKGADINGYYGP